MYKDDKQNQEEQNFWISYADLMAGLLFVFVLLVGAIVVRYVYIQKDLAQKQAALGSSNDKLKSLKALLHQKVTELDGISNSLSLKNVEVGKLKDLILDYERESNESKAKIEEVERNLVKGDNILILKDEEIAALGAKLLEQSKAHQMLVEELNITKVKIKNLTGIRIKVIQRLKQRLGSSINIDPQSGAIRFSSNILFNKGDFKLKQSAKNELKEVLKNYIHTLLFDDEIKKYIDNITIEGYTDTDGSYLFNLALSQKRALEVMKFLYTSDSQNKEIYSRYLSASGRSYSNLIYDEYGKEDKDASRRIEIKFRIKNEKSIKELEKFLNR